MHRILLALALMIWPAAALAQSNGLTPPKPRNDRAAWIVRQDYPVMEIVKRDEGTTVFELAVGADGRPKSCSIVQSSGSAALDETACSKLMTRARFDPARDASGRKVEGRYRSRVTWKLPQFEPAKPFDPSKPPKMVRMPPGGWSLGGGADIEEIAADPDD